MCGASVPAARSCLRPHTRWHGFPLLPGRSINEAGSESDRADAVFLPGSTLTQSEVSGFSLRNTAHPCSAQLPPGADHHAGTCLPFGQRENALHADALRLDSGATGHGRKQHLLPEQEGESCERMEGKPKLLRTDFRQALTDSPRRLLGKKLRDLPETVPRAVDVFQRQPASQDPAATEECEGAGHSGCTRPSHSMNRSGTEHRPPWRMLRSLPGGQKAMGE